jgi:Tol biopolymer transport system component
MTRSAPGKPGRQKDPGAPAPHARAAFALLTVILALATNVREAQAQPCDVTQITFTAGGGQGGGFGIRANDSPAINSDGTRMAFASNRDLTGGNADLSFEIFLYDTTTNSFTQVTNATGDHTSSFDASINSDGTRIAFESLADLTGGNADSNYEIFLYDATTLSLTQVTNTTGGGNLRPSINSDGTRIAFDSRADLTGGNADGNQEIFLYNATTNSFTQVTHTTGDDNTFDPSINSDGTRIAFSSTRDLTGSNADGNVEIFLYNATTTTFTQVTNTTGSRGNYHPSINSDGRRIAFESELDLTGGNADGNNEIFLYDEITNSIIQVTNTTGGGIAPGPPNTNPSINSDGTRIAFESDRDLSGGNADTTFEFFLYNVTSNSFTQITNTTLADNGYSHASINGDGTRIAFDNSANVTGDNADENSEIFLASCSPSLTLSGFYQPVDMGDVWNIVKNGSTVPLKFEVFDGSTEVTDTAIVVQPLTATQTVCSGGAIDEIELTATGGTSLRYDAASGQFVYTWQTPRKRGYCYIVTLTLTDGSSLSAKFQLK